jgi:hypothetical protein
MLSAMDTEQGDFDTSDHVREERVETESVEAGAKVQDKARRKRMKMDEISNSLQELDDIDARIQQLLVTPAPAPCHPGQPIRLPWEVRGSLEREWQARRGGCWREEEAEGE